MKIETVAVCGAGTMGSAIAQHFCMKGLKVKLFDLNQTALENAQTRMAASVQEAVQKGILTADRAQSVLGNVQLVSQLAELGDVDLVVEAIFEDKEIKKTLFKDLERTVSKDCLLASNTSSFLVSELAAGMALPERFVGVHYFYHAAKNKLVEIIAGEKTNPRAIERLERFYRSIDKIPIRVKDAPGFAVNRFFVPWLNEATRLYQEGLGSIAGIDRLSRELFQIGMGPFALMNATGVPIAMHAAKGLAEKLGSFYAPSEILKKQVAIGLPWNLTDEALLPGGGANESLIRRRLLAASVGIAAALVEEGVATAESVDLGARVGLKWERGPFELTFNSEREAKIGSIAAQFKEWGLAAPKFPAKLEWVKAEVVGSDAYIIFEIPDRMNPLSEDVVTCLEEKWNEVESLPAVERIFFLGRGKAFVAGADIKFFLAAMEKGDYRRICEFTSVGQKLFSRITNSKKKTVAYLNGLTLGGGLELALSCQFRLATKNAVLAFPETGIGIYPGLGGTQRTSRLLGRGVAKYLVATGAVLNSQKALSFGLVDRIVDVVEDMHELRSVGDIITQSGRVANPPEEMFAAFDGRLSQQALLEPVVLANEKVLKRKAPKALAIAMRLIDEGQGLSLSEGLNLELKHLEEIFKTQDAFAGLSAVINKNRPEFQGK